MKKFICSMIVILTILMMAGCGAKKESTSIRIGALKGPTTMGLVKLMDDANNAKTANEYSFTMAAGADELLPKMISGDLDIALVPANVAAVLYNKTNGGIKVIDINTLGVLYAVSGDDSITEVSDLKGKSVFLTGKGTTPDYVTQYLLQANGIDIEDVAIEYKSEATEVAAMLKERPDSVGILPQPFVTAACMQNESLNVVLDYTKEWNEISNESGSRLVTGVTVVRSEFLSEHEDAVKEFLSEHKASAEYINANPEDGAKLVVSTGIIEKEPIALKAIPLCNITYIDGKDMKDSLSGYLSVLFNLDPSTVGGALPDEDFYY